MKLFQITQAAYARVGITSNQLISFNWKLLMVSVLYGLFCIFHLIFYVTEVNSAQNFAEYNDWFFASLTQITVTMYFTITIANSKKLFNYIEISEKFVRESE